jgi:hypothetical protein
MATGLIAIGIQYLSQIRIQKYPAVEGSVDLAVAKGAILPGTEAVVIETVAGRRGMALVAECHAGLLQQHIVDRSMRLMALRAGTSLHQMIVYGRVLVKIWTCYLLMATLTHPVEFHIHPVEFDRSKIEVWHERQKLSRSSLTSFLM